MLIQATSFRISLISNSVHCIVTSPPYWGLRNYGLKPMVFGGQSDCEHIWNEPNRPPHSGQVPQTKWANCDAVSDGQNTTTGQFCQLCGAWLGSYGLEPTIALYVKHSVEVARECWRVLRPDGVMWWNLGDSYATSRNGRSAADGKVAGNDDRTFRDKPFSVDEIPAKNLCLIPERIAIALQDDGWYVRSIAPWIKRNAMPSSVQDRPGTAHEVILMLTKEPRYYFDMESVRRQKAESTITDPRTNTNGRRRERGFPGSANNGGTNLGGPSGGRALRTSDFFFDSLDAHIHHLETVRDKGGMMIDEDGVPAALVVNPRGYAGCHYATYPVELVAPMIKCSTSEKGVCPKCGAPWIRVKEAAP